MTVQRRNNVHVTGSGPTTMVFAHGFGCDQNMWRFLAPRFSEQFTVVAFDLVGSGHSDLAAYDYAKYDSLAGYADDLIEIIDEFANGPVIFVGHSVGAMIGVLADLKGPQRFKAHIMVGPSPSFINDGDYVGGFNRSDIDSLLETLEGNYLGWSSTMAPAIMGAPSQPDLSDELSNSFCATDPDIAKHFARVTFLADHRREVAQLQTRALLIQCSEDLLAPLSVGQYLKEHMPNATLAVVENVGHCPHMSAPGLSTDAMNAFISTL